MNKIVDNGLKLDLHIHSSASRDKDGRKVSGNTIESIPLLIQKLDENGVNLCAITDHDRFSYEMYSALKTSETQENSILKVLPGVEFSVNFSNGLITKTLHVVTVFSDADDSKLVNMEAIIDNNRPDVGMSYSEAAFLSLLRKIDIDTILIVHQKKSIAGGSPGKNDASSLGEDKFLEFVNTDYFEAFEFRNKRNEVFNKSFLNEEGLTEKVRFVTGTDCHDWTVYPNEEKGKNDSFPYTYAKCLPTFRGLVMAITDHTRLRTGNNSFFSTEKFYLSSLEFASSGNKISVPLSKGINVIIGDNSVGKSLLLHAITGFNKPAGQKISPAVISGYKSYLKDHSLEVKTKLDEEQIFCFDMQGEVRSKFEEGRLTTSEFLGNYFPEAIDPTPYRNTVEREIDRMIDYLKKKFDLDNMEAQLQQFTLFLDDSPAESIIFSKNLRRTKPKSDKLTRLISAIDTVIVSISETLKHKEILDEDDAELILSMKAQIENLIEKYGAKVDAINSECDRIEIVASVIDRKSSAHHKGTSDTQKKKATFSENSSSLTAQIVSLVRAKEALREFSFGLETTPITPRHRKLHNYEFISRLELAEISNYYMESLLSRVLKKGQSINWSNITVSELQEKIYRYDSSIPVLQFLKVVMLEKLTEDLQPSYSIIVDGEDRYRQMSSGINSKIYFDLLSYETLKNGIYIIDQPEDNVSQSAIREYLLDRFKTMGENRQIIMVTHNPQFVVNLDVDNLIFLSVHDNEIEIKSGALEYVCDDYSVLDIVAQNIDGGLESIQKRWKRYEKVSEI